LKGRGAGLLWLGLAIALGLLPAPAAAQGNFEIQVYGSETVPRGKTMFELHTNSAILGSTQTDDGTRPTQHALHETLEVTHGWTEWFETGFYLFTSIQPDDGWEWVGNHIRPRVRVPEDWNWPVGLSLSLEVGYQRREYSTDTWTLEIRPIIDKQIGPWYFSFNPVLAQTLKGEGTRTGIEFAPNAKIGFDVTKVVSPGLEYYGNLGPVGHISPVRHQQHMVFTVIDLNVDPRWEINAGVGVGLTHDTDRLILKMILGRRF
jgi:hypothetical protein